MMCFGMVTGYANVEVVKIRELSSEVLICPNCP